MCILVVKFVNLLLCLICKLSFFSLEMLHNVFYAIIVSKLVCGISAWYSFLVKAQISQINSFLSELLSMVMLNLSSLLKSYWAAMMSIYFTQHPVKTIACITFYRLPSLPNTHYE